MKILFKDKRKSYSLILFFGILMRVMSGLTAIFRLADSYLISYATREVPVLYLNI